MPRVRRSLDKGEGRLLSQGELSRSKEREREKKKKKIGTAKERGRDSSVWAFGRSCVIVHARFMVNGITNKRGTVSYSLNSISIRNIAALLKALKRGKQRNRLNGRAGRGIYCRSLREEDLCRFVLRSLHNA